MRRQLQLPGDSYLTELLRQVSSGSMSPAKSSERLGEQLHMDRSDTDLVGVGWDGMAVDVNADTLGLKPLLTSQEPSSFPPKGPQLQQHAFTESSTSDCGSPSIASLLLASSFQMQPQLSIPEDLFELLGFTPRAVP
jgi:hypothetical protein